MGKSTDKAGGFLTPKAIANRIKAKGLQKLRWYCQMCQKQCRDENGFKCHCMSESHQRQMELFSQNSTTIMDEFSKEFEEGMMEIIGRKARSQRCSANVIYREYIGNRHHFHMNSTIWETLTDFVMYLGRSGKCEVDETEKGWFVTYIDRDPETLRKMEERAKRERSELDSEEKHQRDIQRLVKAARAEGGVADAPAATELQRDDPEAKVEFKVPFAKGPLGKGPAAKPKPAAASFFADEPTEAEGGSSSGAGSSSDAGGGGGGGAVADKKRAIADLMAEQERRKDAQGRTDYWLAPGIVVKVMNRKLSDGKYYKQKGEVEAVSDRYTAKVRMISSGDLVRLDQDDLETVIPAVGGRVRIVNGGYRGAAAKLTAIDVDNFCVQLRVEGGEHGGRVLDKVEYEDVCKLAG